MERYTRIYSLPTNLYAEGSLVILEAGALLKDNANGTMLAQIKFKNINPKAIKMLKVEIIPKDSMGRVLKPSTTYQYLDLNAQRDESFGSQQAISLPDHTVRSFDVKILEIGLEDNSIVRGEITQWNALPLPEILSDAELLKQYQIENGADCKYKVEEICDLWICACGIINNRSEANCHKCNRSLTSLVSIDFEQLDALKKVRLSEEMRLAEEAQQIEKEQAAIKQAELDAKKKKTIKILSVVLSIAIVAVAAITFISKSVKKSTLYHTALDLYEAGQYEDARTILTELGDYKDSKELLANSYTPFQRLCKYVIQNGVSFDNKILAEYGLDGAKEIKALMAPDNNDDAQAYLIVPDDTLNSIGFVCITSLKSNQSTENVLLLCGLQEGMSDAELYFYIPDIPVNNAELSPEAVLLELHANVDIEHYKKGDAVIPCDYDFLRTADTITLGEGWEREFSKPFTYFFESYVAKMLEYAIDESGLAITVSDLGFSAY